MDITICPRGRLLKVLSIFICLVYFTEQMVWAGDLASSQIEAYKACPSGFAPGEYEDRQEQIASLIAVKNFVDNFKKDSGEETVIMDQIGIGNTYYPGGLLSSREIFLDGVSSDGPGPFVKHYYLEEDAGDGYGRVKKVEVVESYLQFSSDKDVYVDCGNNDSLNFTGSFSLVANARISKNGGGYLISKRDGNDSQYGMAIAPDSGALTFVYGDRSGMHSVSLNHFYDDWRDEEWHQFAVTVDVRKGSPDIYVRGYVDGKCYR